MYVPEIEPAGHEALQALVATPESDAQPQNFAGDGEAVTFELVAEVTTFDILVTEKMWLAA